MSGATGFVGREDYLSMLASELELVRSEGVGRFVSMRGRRRVGKSRLVEEFLRTAGVPSVFYAATRETPEGELETFVADVAESSLPGAAEITGGLGFRNWSAIFSWIADRASRESPSVVVLDELPYLVESDPGFEAMLQRAWDRAIGRKPVMLIVVGSDVSMMEALNQYGRPLFQRPTREVVVDPLTPWEIASMLGLPAGDAFGAYLAIGGFPLIARAWRRSKGLWSFLAEQLADPTSPLIVTGERIIRAEFPSETQAVTVFQAIGDGERTFTGIQRDVGGIQAASLSRALTTLTESKRVVSAVLPHAPRKSRETRYLVGDPYLRFWLRFVRPNLDVLERGRGDIVLERIKRDWAVYRGRAVEPVVQRSVERLLPDERFGEARTVGGYWTRTNQPEVDLVGLAYDDHVRPSRVAFVGSIKWRGTAKFDRADTRALAAVLPAVPGVDTDTLLVGVSASGFKDAGLDVELSPDDLLAAWRPVRSP